MTIRSDHHHERGVDVGPPIGVEPSAATAAAPSSRRNSNTTTTHTPGATGGLCHTGQWLASAAGVTTGGAFGTSSGTATGQPYGKPSGFMDHFFGCMRPFDRLFSFASRSASGAEGNVGTFRSPSGWQRDQWEIPFEEILELEWVGSGAQGTVFSGKLHDEIVAVKKVRDLKETDIKHLRKLDHENIIKFK